MSVKFEVAFETTVVDTKTVSFGVECGECGKALEVAYDPRHETLYVEPCQYCLKKAQTEGREEVKDA